MKFAYVLTPMFSALFYIRISFKNDPSHFEILKNYMCNIMHNIIFLLIFSLIKFIVMLPTKEGQIVKFHTPMEDEDPEQIFVLLELKEDGERSRADIQPLELVFHFPLFLQYCFQIWKW